jgi:hypothetical protein
MSMLKSGRSKAGGVAAVLLASVVALSATLAPGSSAQGDSSPSAAVPSGLSAGFSALQRATPERVEALSAKSQQLLHSIGNGNIEAIAVIPEERSSSIIAAVGGSVCALQPGNGGACGSPEEALGGQLLSVSFCDAGVPEGSARVFGLMPDLVADVHVETGEDANSSSAISVDNNLYEAVLPAAPTTLTATGPNGGKIQIQLPLGQLAAANSPCASH